MTRLEIAAVFGLVAIAPSHAQQTSVAEAHLVEIVETYEEVTKVSAGSPLVGLQLGPAAAALQLDKLTIVGPGEAGDRICLRASTQDGRYAASATYALTDAPQDATLVSLRPLTETYADDLARYDPAEYAVRAFIDPDGSCAPNEATHLPAVADPAAIIDRLFIAVNSRSRQGAAELRALDGDSPFTAAPCTQAGEASLIAFDLVCALDIPADRQGGVAELRLVFDDGFAETTYDYKILLPSLGLQIR